MKLFFGCFLLVFLCGGIARGFPRVTINIRRIVPVPCAAGTGPGAAPAALLAREIRGLRLRISFEPRVRCPPRTHDSDHQIISTNTGLLKKTLRSIWMAIVALGEDLKTRIFLCFSRRTVLPHTRHVQITWKIGHATENGPRKYTKNKYPNILQLRRVESAFTKKMAR